MSAIDCYRHELVGLVAGLQLYHPLEAISASAADFDADERHLLLGGGSGEHPQAVLDPVQCAAQFLFTLADRYLDEDNLAAWQRDDALALAHRFGCDTVEDAELLLIGDTVEQLLGRPDGGFDLGDFSAWGGDEWARFVAAAENPGGWTLPYDRSAFATIEGWVGAVVGEFVWVSMPELLGSARDRVPDRVVDAVRELASQRPVMRGVMTFPSGYEHEGGRRLELGDGNVRH